MTSKRKKRLPIIYFDEHIAPGIVAIFRPLFRIIKISQARKLKGRDELDYLAELYARNGMLVTSDISFINTVIDNRKRHAGIVYIPNELDDDEKTMYAEIVSGYIQGACSVSPFAFRNRVIYPADDGLRSVLGGEEELEFSWDWLSEMANRQ